MGLQDFAPHRQLANMHTCIRINRLGSLHIHNQKDWAERGQDISCRFSLCIHIPQMCSEDSTPVLVQSALWLLFCMFENVSRHLTLVTRSDPGGVDISSPLYFKGVHAGSAMSPCDSKKCLWHMLIYLRRNICSQKVRLLHQAPLLM